MRQPFDVDGTLHPNHGHADHSYARVRNKEKEPAGQQLNPQQALPGRRLSRGRERRLPRAGVWGELRQETLMWFLFRSAFFTSKLSNSLFKYEYDNTNLTELTKLCAKNLSM